MNFFKKTGFLFVGMGPGETSQARAMAKYVNSRGGKVLFVLHQEKNIHFFAKDKELKIFLIKNPRKLKRFVEKEKPGVLLFFNSKMWGGCQDFLEKPLFSKSTLSFCFDSNWLFNTKKYPAFPFIKWADKYFIIFPKKIFELGLKENGGNFEIPKPILKKIIPVGFIPSYKKPSRKEILKKRKEYGIKPGEKFIFSYFSGFGAAHRIWAFKNFVASIDRLIKKRGGIKAVYVGPIENLDPKELKRDWLIIKEKLSAEDYFLTLASSDLVFQHQGLGTLAQAVSAQIPVIANISLLSTGKPVSRLHFWEVNPFKKAGACELLWKSDPIGKISQKIEKLLFKRGERLRMQKKQKLIYEEGEKKAFEIIKRCLK